MNSNTSGSSTNFTTFSLFGDSFEISMFTINVLFSLPTNTYILWLIVTGTGNGLASEFFNFNFSVCEIGICLDIIFFALLKWVSFLMPLALFFLGLAISGRPLFQCLMCVERYLAVVHPVTFLKYKPLRYRVICCSVIWIFIFGCGLVCMSTLMSNNFKAHTWFFSVEFFLFLSIQLFCLVAVLRALKRSGPGERKREREEKNRMKRRAFFLIVITTANMVIAYGPIIVAGMCIILTNQYMLTFWVPAVVCYVFAGFVQPALFLQRAGKLPCTLHVEKHT